MEEGVLADRNLPNRLHFFLPLLVPVQQLLLPRVVAPVAFGSHMFLHMRNLLFRYGFGAYSGLDGHRKQMRRNGFLDFPADSLTIFKSFFVVEKKG